MDEDHEPDRWPASSMGGGTTDADGQIAPFLTSDPLGPGHVITLLCQRRAGGDQILVRMSL